MWQWHVLATADKCLLILFKKITMIWIKRGRAEKKEKLKLCTNFFPLALLFACCCGVKGLGDYWLVVTGTDVNKNTHKRQKEGWIKVLWLFHPHFHRVWMGKRGQRLTQTRTGEEGTQPLLAEIAFAEEGSRGRWGDSSFMSCVLFAWN